MSLILGHVLHLLIAWKCYCICAVCLQLWLHIHRGLLQLHTKAVLNNVVYIISAVLMMIWLVSLSIFTNTSVLVTDIY